MVPKLHSAGRIGPFVLNPEQEKVFGLRRVAFVTITVGDAAQVLSGQEVIEIQVPPCEDSGVI